jgi:hypothetical protein
MKMQQFLTPGSWRIMIGAEESNVVISCTVIEHILIV